MKLISVEINGFRRLSSVSVNLDEPVIAIVGPNEAGKSSLLDALTSIEDSTEYHRSDITRGRSLASSDAIVKALYELEDEELRFAQQLGGIGQPRWYVREKLRGGSITHAVEEPILRNKGPRQKAIDRINRNLQSSVLEEAMDETVQLPSKDEQQPATVVMLRDSLASLIEQLQEAEEILSPETLELIDRAVVTLTIIEDSRSGRKRRSLEITREHLEDLRKAERAPHPEEALLEELDTRRPRFLPFEDDHRLLRGEYTHEELENPPDALANLLRLAEIDIRQLRRALNNNDPASRETITTRANSVLRDKFTEAWGQSFLSVHIQADTDVLRILINSEDEFSQIAERSDGLKAFVALFSYTAVQSPGQEKPVLLIDEAERHLHYDAQADLVRVFENQDRAAKIIYTTHSAGCLPSDLGRGVRAVVQILDNLIDTGKSSINNSFWTEGAGFSPLMLAMGASLLALVPTRRAVFAEGPSDMMLLPSMFRETANEGQLGFQVAPGISVVSADDIAALELEAPRIAYLVDGDDGGDKIIAKLKGGGVPDEMIVQLERPYATEDLLNLKVLVTAINTELRRSHGDVHQIDESILGKHGRMLKLTEWCIGKGVDPPSKSRVAAHVVEDMRNRTILDLERVPKVSRALAEIRKILFPEG